MTNRDDDENVPLTTKSAAESDEHEGKTYGRVQKLRNTRDAYIITVVSFETTHYARVTSYTIAVCIIMNNIIKPSISAINRTLTILPNGAERQFFNQTA